MRKETVKEAATVEEAVALAAAELGVEADSLQVTVLQEPQKKTFGLFGGQPAKIQAVFEVKGGAAQRAKDYLEQVLTAMGAKNLSVSIVSEADNNCQLSLEGEDVGFVIGRRGDTLDALQYLTGLVANRVDNAYYRVTINVGDYREKREQSLSGLARRHASQAAKTGRKFSLEPMNPYERRIIHTAVQEIKGATSWSVGKEPNRHVIIGPSDDNPVRQNRRSRNDDRRQNGGRRGEQNGERPARPARQNRENAAPRGEKRSVNDSDLFARYSAQKKDQPVHEFVSRSNPLPVADGVTPPDKTVSEVETGDTKLYGRIEIDQLIMPERKTLKDVGLDADAEEE